MELICADCSCVVDTGTRLRLCGNVQCCCSALPVETTESFARRVACALDDADLEAFRALLGTDARWGDPYESVATCQSREQILEWYARARDQGVRARVSETTVIDHHILVTMLVRRPSKSVAQATEEERWQVLTVDNGSITSIRGYETLDEAELAMTAPSPWGMDRP